LIGQISEGALLSLQLSSDLEEFAFSDETSWASPDLLRNSAEAIHKLFDEAFSIGLKCADDYRKKVEIFLFFYWTFIFYFLEKIQSDFHVNKRR
jgi:hypothetical protein